jgi:hypothetical protein
LLSTKKRTLTCVASYVRVAIISRLAFTNRPVVDDPANGVLSAVARVSAFSTNARGCWRAFVIALAASCDW